MAKKNKDAGELAKESASLKPNGEQHRPLPWVEPFPASKLDAEGKNETVFVRATTSQDIILNGKAYKAGQHTLPANFAHAHASVLSAPK